MTIERREDVSVITHSLAQHVLTDLRSVDTEQVAFRKGLVRLGRVCGYEIIDSRMPTESVAVETPLTETTGRVRRSQETVHGASGVTRRYLTVAAGSTPDRGSSVRPATDVSSTSTVVVGEHSSTRPAAARNCDSGPAVQAAVQCVGTHSTRTGGSTGIALLLPSSPAIPPVGTRG